MGVRGYSRLAGKKFLEEGGENRFNTEGAEEEHREHRGRGTRDGGVKPPYIFWRT
jgi:hypothetical protein